MARRKMRDPVNQPNVEFIDKRGPVSLGLLKGREWIEDPRRFVFSLARYKFVAKMLAGRTNVIEIGCGDAFAAPIVMQEVAKLTVTDFDGEFIEDADQRRTPEYPYKTVVHDFLDGPLLAQQGGHVAVQHPVVEGVGPPEDHHRDHVLAPAEVERLPAHLEASPLEACLELALDYLGVPSG